MPNFSKEIFTVSKRLPRNPPVYKLKDYDGEELKGTFYDKELQKVIKHDDVYTAGCKCHDCDLLPVRKKKSRWRPELSILKYHANCLLEICSAYAKYIIGLKEFFRTI